MSKIILNIRKFYKDSYNALRRYNLKRVVTEEKKSHTTSFVLTKEQQTSAKKYYSKYKNISLLYHNFYTEKREEYLDYYLPDDIYYNYVDMYYNDHQAALVYDNKCHYDKYFPNVLQPKTVAKRVNGFWFSGGDTNGFWDLKEVYKKVVSTGDCFIKRATDCGGGTGVYYFNPKKDTEREFLNTISKIPDDIIIQEPIKQNEVLSKINPSSVNTVRVMSFLRRDEKPSVKIYATVLRMGVSGNKVDNESSGGITVNIDENGMLGKRAYKKDGTSFEKHPDTGVVFENMVLPSFDKICEAVCELHLSIPQFRLVSWDFTVDENGNAVLIETNMSSSGINVIQLSHGPLFGEDTHKILDEVFSCEG